MLKNALWLFTVAVVLLAAFLPSYAKLQDLRQKRRQYEIEIQRLQEETARLREEKRLLEEDPVYLEKIGREKMGLIKEGEVIYRMTPQE